jgi:hypothetical protein
MLEVCKFTGKPCPGSVVTTDGERSTWSLVSRLSKRGKTQNPIGTGSLRDNYIFENFSPKEVALVLSEKEKGPFGIFHTHSCETCTGEVEKVLDKLGLIPDENYLSPIEE